jgi:hypothetical protein
MKARRQRCTAHISDGSRQCERWAINGGGVCATHGGRAPQVQRSAKERLAELVEPALKGLHTALKSGEIPSIVKAAQIVLDRTGFHPSQAIELTGKDGGPIETESSKPIPVESLSLHVKKLILFELDGGQLSKPLVDGIMEEIDDAQLEIRPDYQTEPAESRLLS